jgi:phosphodiesterase/alkaline phosphatase D-like protein
MIKVRYFVDLGPIDDESLESFFRGECIECESKIAAIAMAKAAYAARPSRFISARQVGTAGGDPATATGLIWSKSSGGD